MFLFAIALCWAVYSPMLSDQRTIDRFGLILPDDQGCQLKVYKYSFRAEHMLQKEERGIFTLHDASIEYISTRPITPTSLEIFGYRSADQSFWATKQ